ncbi:hypothetical protein NU08_0596 [Flavobacterium anhuiense]|uniref:Uncharacterized protein n=1 Tax=Flavobacterium anhuiense TaxID=459526 RepID=A0A444W1R1_9FLAO|nr:hypothetical protein NU08_0596 [Flavobacterium anhuiense]
MLFHVKPFARIEMVFTFFKWQNLVIEKICNHVNYQIF